MAESYRRGTAGRCAKGNGLDTGARCCEAPGIGTFTEAEQKGGCRAGGVGGVVTGEGEGDGYAEWRWGFSLRRWKVLGY